jgi:hypothetical protein
MKRAAAFLAIALGAAVATRTAGAEMIALPVAALQGLDKITGRASDFAAPVGKTVRFGDLSILVRACAKSPPEDAPQSAAFLEIDAVRPGEAAEREFSGWMFAQSPALSSLEDPIYDVIVLDCKAAGAPAAASSTAAPASSAGNTAR